MENTKKTKSWDELTFADNFMFCKILESEPEICKRLLELLLHIEIDHLEAPSAEHIMQESPDSKSVRFDVYTKDKNRIFDLEMQTIDTKNLPKRARYYQNIIDMSNLNKGMNYSKLKDTYIIFLCLDDIFHEELPVYFFENVCRENHRIKLRDGTYKLFFNAKNCDKLKTAEERDFFRFLRGQGAELELSRRIEERIKIAKKNLAWRNQYMTWQQTIDEEKEIAYEEGERANKIANAKNLLSMNIITPEQISMAIELPLEEVLALKEEMSKEAAALVK